jgi:hypothetical protein
MPGSPSEGWLRLPTGSTSVPGQKKWKMEGGESEGCSGVFPFSLRYFLDPLRLMRLDHIQTLMK